MSEKKRKRRQHGGERPAKKLAVASQDNIQVELVENDKGLGPVLAVTPGIEFPSRLSFTPYRRTDILPEGVTQHLLLHSSEHPRLDYTAQEEADGSAEGQLQDYVGVFDPATNKLQLMPVKRLTLRTTLRSETEDMLEEQEMAEAQQQTMMAKRNTLANEFGSRKSKKALNDMTLNAIRSSNPDDASNTRNEAVADNILQHMETAVSAMPTKDDLAAAVDSSKPRPVPNMSAEYPGDVYPIDTVVGSELMTLLDVKDWVDASTAGQGVNVTSKFVARRIAKLARNKQIQKLKVLRFILLSINFGNSLMGGGRNAKKIPPKSKLEDIMGADVPRECVAVIRKKFAKEGTNDMPRWNVDRLYAYIAAAALIVDDNEVDVNELRDDLNLDNKQIQAYFLELGCRVTAPTAANLAKWQLSRAEAINHYIAKLRLPLKFPKISGPKSNKSRK